MRKQTMCLAIVFILPILLWGWVSPSSVAQIVLPPYTTDPTCNLALGAWQADTPLPNGAFHLEGAMGVVNGRLYTLSGYDDGGTFTLTDRVDVYDFATQTWINGAIPHTVIPRLNSHVQGAVVDDRYIWMVGGFPDVVGSLPIDDVYRYDTVTNTFDVMPAFPVVTASGALVFNQVTRTLHYFGGLDLDRMTNQPAHWALDVDNVGAGWQVLAPFPMPRNHFQGVEINGIIYAVGGQQGHDGAHADTALLHSYNPLTNTWTQLADMPLSRSHAESATFVMNERIIIIAGSDSLGGNAQVANVTTYNPQTNVWTELTPIPVPIYGAIAGTDGTRILVTGGGLTNNNLQLNSWSADFVTTCPPIATPPPINPPPSVNPPSPAIGVFDPSISKLGFLLPDQLGVTGERLEWVVTISNTGTGAGSNVVISDTLRDELRIDRVDAPNAQVTINGQTVQVRYPTLNMGETVQFSIFTTVLQGRSVENTACVTADNLSGQVCASGLAVSSLPATGETPLMRTLMLVMLLIAGLGMIISFFIRRNTSFTSRNGDN